MNKILGAIFGSSKNTETLVNSAVSGADKLFYTKEEKAENAVKMSEWFLRYLEASQPQNLARRFIALTVVGLWAVLILMGIIVYKIDLAYSEFVFSVLKDIVMNPFLIIMGFYFAAHVVRTAMSGKTQ